MRCADESQSMLVSLSRKLSFLLRHKPLQHDKNHRWVPYQGGFFEITSVAKQLKRHEKLEETVENIKRVVAFSKSQREPYEPRFSILRCGETLMVRANYGHSYDVTRGQSLPSHQVLQPDTSVTGTVALVSKWGDVFHINKAWAQMSNFLTVLLDDHTEDDVGDDGGNVSTFNLPELGTNDLLLVVKFLESNSSTLPMSGTSAKWPPEAFGTKIEAGCDADTTSEAQCDRPSSSVVLRMISVASYLDIPALLELSIDEVISGLCNKSGMAGTAYTEIVSDQHLSQIHLHRIWTEIKHRGLFNTRVLKIFARPNTTKLDFSGVSLTESNLRYVGRTCQILHSLSIPNCSILNQSMIHFLCKNLKSLHTLDVSGCEQINSGAMEAFAKFCPKLRALNITGCARVPIASVEMLKLSLPNVVINAQRPLRVWRQEWDQKKIRERGWLSLFMESAESPGEIFYEFKHKYRCPFREHRVVGECPGAILLENKENGRLNILRSGWAENVRTEAGAGGQPAPAGNRFPQANNATAEAAAKIINSSHQPWVSGERGNWGSHTEHSRLLASGYCPQTHKIWMPQHKLNTN